MFLVYSVFITWGILFCINWQLCVIYERNLRSLLVGVGDEFWVLKPHLHDTTGCRTDNRLYRVNKHPTGCQTGLYNRFDNRLYTRYSRLSNRLSNGFDDRLNVCIHDTPVVKPVWQLVWQQVVSCKRGFSIWSASVLCVRCRRATDAYTSLSNFRRNSLSVDVEAKM